MARRNKLMKFAEMATFPNVYQVFDPTDPVLTGANGVEFDLKGKWKNDHFENNFPITLELGCGKGDYTLGLADKFSERNFIGVDIKGSRIWKGAREALSKQVKNVAFLRTRIEVIEHCFGKHEIDEIWITFPDPFLRESKENRRLTAPHFLNKYRNICIDNPVIHLKTDSVELYDYTLESISGDQEVKILYHSNDIYSGKLYSESLEVKTFYEKMHLKNGLTIKYIQFTI